MYKLLPKSEYSGLGNVQRLSDNAFIPFDPDNTDAVEFCKWLKAGNIPEAADGETTPTQEEINDIIAKLS